MGSLNERTQLLANLKFLYGPDTEVLTLYHASGYQAVAMRFDTFNATWTKFLHATNAVSTNSAILRLLRETEIETAKRFSANGIGLPFSGEPVQNMSLHRRMHGLSSAESSASSDPSGFEIIATPLSSLPEEDGAREALCEDSEEAPPTPEWREEAMVEETFYEPCEEVAPDIECYPEETVAEEAVVEELSYEPYEEVAPTIECYPEETVVDELSYEPYEEVAPAIECYPEEPIVEEPVVEEELPVEEAPAVEEEPIAEEPIVEEEAVEEEAAAEEPVVEEEPAVEEAPAIEEEAVAEEPVVEEPAVEEPIAEESVVEEPEPVPEDSGWGFSSRKKDKKKKGKVIVEECPLEPEPEVLPEESGRGSLLSKKDKKKKGKGKEKKGKKTKSTPEDPFLVEKPVPEPALQDPERELDDTPILEYPAPPEPLVETIQAPPAPQEEPLAETIETPPAQEEIEEPSSIQPPAGQTVVLKILYTSRTGTQTLGTMVTLEENTRKGILSAVNSYLDSRIPQGHIPDQRTLEIKYGTGRNGDLELSALDENLWPEYLEYFRQYTKFPELTVDVVDG
ncbi:hypothetical protein G7Y89_g14025 [Cudoniella acicularis]|uniref:Uncharacterized protein n=1 Tax=Cudoniella acicularis TaxID=354080 RepID=A0A8H4VVF9_9HELO|nr:hypothetical protein G7Y89_g14025 [Cudoniella acicularis]